MKNGREGRAISIKKMKRRTRRRLISLVVPVPAELAVGFGLDARPAYAGFTPDGGKPSPEYRVPRSPLPDGDSADKLLHEAATSM
jgi:hypothetical protein